MGEKFMNFSFWPFLWFGLPGRLLLLVLQNTLLLVLQNTEPRGNRDGFGGFGGCDWFRL